jgi:DNA polymerase (family 10)
MERLMEGAKERRCFLELNAHPDRLDLTDIHCKRAKRWDQNRPLDRCPQHVI